jgi:hypothetical protein
MVNLQTLFKKTTDKAIAEWVLTPAVTSIIPLIKCHTYSWEGFA